MVATDRAANRQDRGVPEPVSRRRALGIFGAVGAAGAGLVAAVRSLSSPAPTPVVAAGTLREKESYGELARRVGEWWVPPGATGRLPTVVLVHGGYWRAQYDLSLQDAVAADLAGRGFLVWNIDYRPSAQAWPATLDDVAAGYDHLRTGRFADRVDPARVATVGHSAGGHLALWLASSRPDRPRTGPVPALAVGQAPVAALADGSRLGLGGGAVDALLGGPPQRCPERYAQADPVALLPTGVRTVCVHGTADDIVPLSQSRTYVQAAKAAGDDARLVEVPGGHFEHLDPSSAAIGALREALATL